MKTDLKLRQRRALAGLTQEMLAYQSGLSVATVRRIEQGDGRPTRGTLRLLAIALDCQPDDLLPTDDEAACLAPRVTTGEPTARAHVASG